MDEFKPYRKITNIMQYLNRRKRTIILENKKIANLYQKIAEYLPQNQVIYVIPFEAQMFTNKEDALKESGSYMHVRNIKIMYSEAADVVKHDELILPVGAITKRLRAIVLDLNSKEFPVATKEFGVFNNENKSWGPSKFFKEEDYYRLKFMMERLLETLP